MKRYLIYRLKSPSGKSYIGQTRQVSVHRRFTQHLQGWEKWNERGRPRKAYGAKLFYAFNKYPPNQWIVSVLYETMNREQANRLERAAIKLFDTVRIGYNIQAGGEGWLKLSLKEEHKERIGRARVEYFLSEEGREWKKELRKRFHEDNPGKYASKMKGKKHSEEGKKKMSVAGKLRSREVRTCPHCGLKGRGPVMERFHFHHCKKKREP